MRNLPPASIPPRKEGLQKGIVASVYAQRVFVYMPNKELLLCSQTGKLRQALSLVVGDHVMVDAQPGQMGHIVSCLPRLCEVVRDEEQTRHSKTQTTQVLAANVEQLIIVASLKTPPLRPGLIERLIVAARRASIAPVICITKIDLAPAALWEPLKLLYAELAIPLFGVSIHNPASLAPLKACLKQKISVLIGHSGVGKTTLSNVLANQQLPVGEVMQTRKGGGRHTTSTAHLLPLLGSGFLIDSPGIRQFGLYGLKPQELALYYPDFKTHSISCGFKNCLHQTEPRCAVKKATAAGTIAPSRYAHYAKLLAEIMKKPL